MCFVFFRFALNGWQFKWTCNTNVAVWLDLYKHDGIHYSTTSRTSLQFNKSRLASESTGSRKIKVNFGQIWHSVVQLQNPFIEADRHNIHADCSKRCVWRHVFLCTCASLQRPRSWSLIVFALKLKQEQPHTKLNKIKNIRSQQQQQKNRTEH